MTVNKIKVFENKTVRTVWNEDEEDWYFSIVDVVAVLTDSKDAAAYWRKLKQRLNEEGNQTVTNCHALKMLAQDGKMRLTDVADTKQLLRLIQSIPSPKAEPFKIWLAQVGAERLDEIADPEKAILRGADFYRAKGYTENWINQRLQTIEMRKELTDEWKARGIEQENDCPWKKEEAFENNDKRCKDYLSNKLSTNIKIENQKIETTEEGDKFFTTLFANLENYEVK